MNITAELHDWHFQPLQNVYWGKIMFDRKDRWFDGQYIHTSSVLSVVEAEDHYLVVTLNSTYKLPKEKQFKVGPTHAREPASCQLRVSSLDLRETSRREEAEGCSF